MPKGSKYYSCDICMSSHSTKNSLNVHKSKYHKKRPSFPEIIDYQLLLLFTLEIYEINYSQIFLDFEYAHEDGSEYVNEQHIDFDSMMSFANGVYMCGHCQYTCEKRQRMTFHIEARHVQGSVYSCDLCDKICSTRNAIRVHKSRFHRS